MKTENTRRSGALVAVIEGNRKWKLDRADQGGRRRYHLILDPHLVLDIGAETARHLAELILADCAGTASTRPAVIPKPEAAAEGLRYRMYIPPWELNRSAARPGRRPGTAAGLRGSSER